MFLISALGARKVNFESVYAVSWLENVGIQTLLACMQRYGSNSAGVDSPAGWDIYQGSHP
ncbi:hypothetical protein NBRC116597_01330 [Phaeobacter sp. NW0010-22]